MRVFKTVLTVLALTVGIAGLAKGESMDKDIVDVAASAGSFKTLIAAVKAAGLVDALKGQGPLTVFAPTDEAFAKLPAGTVENLLKPENKDKLTAVLTYHVVPGRVTADQVINLSSAKTINGRSLQISSMDGKVMVDNARVTSTDIMASNGVIHVLDSVVIP
jgi:transforming growth factor-beta-induced protein